jgi:uncharacterized protein with von Willebrand factor type A (vWA) domain
VSRAPSQVNLLEGVFRELLARKTPIGMRDYLDALRALELGYGRNTRDELRLLCHRLWARNDGDRRAIDTAFSLIARPAAGDLEVEELDKAFLGVDAAAPAAQSATAPRDAGAQPGGVPDTPAAASAKASYAGLTFGWSGEGGIPLAPLAAAQGGRETYVQTPQTIVSKRELTIMWRRLRRLSRRGAPRELDIQATIHEQCRQGVLSRAVLRPARQNTAGLVVLADISPSMAPWHPFLQTLSDSFGLGNLCAFDLLYYSNLPRKWLFRTASLDERIRFDDVARQHAGLPMLIVSDAGAARGQFSPRRVAQTADFLDLAARHFRPIVWLNPMPRTRWHGTSADALVGQPKLSVLPLEKNTLIRAIDVLRGERTA